MTDAASNDRVLVIAGIPRSATTWCFNIVRLALEATGSRHASAWIDDYRPDDDSPYHLVKVHEPNPSLAARATAVVTAHRDLRDVAVSVRRRGWTATDDETIAFLHGAIAHLEDWRSHPRARLDVRYETMRADPVTTATTLLAAFDLEVPSVSDVVTAVDALRAPASTATDAATAYDPVTLLHPDHRSGAGRSGEFSDALPDELLARIDATFAEWLTRHGYAVGADPWKPGSRG